MSGSRTKSGCWTCRLRRKKCDEKKPACFNCVTRSLECYGYDQKPTWMLGKDNWQQVLDSDEAKAIRNAAGRAYTRRRQMTTPGVLVQDTKDFAPRALAFSLDSGTALDRTWSNCTQPLRECDYTPDYQHIQTFLDVIFPLQWGFFDLHRQKPGRTWMFDTIVASEPMYHVSHGLCITFESGVKSGYTNGHCEVTPEVRTSRLRAMRGLQPYIADIQKLKLDTTAISKAINAVAIIILLSSLEIYGETEGAWEIHQNAAGTVLDLIESQMVSSVSTDGGIGTIEQLLANSTPSFEARCLEFFVATYVWTDILVEAVHGTISSKPRHFDYLPLLKRNLIDTRSIMGCRNSVMIAIKDVSLFAASLNSPQELDPAKRAEPLAIRIRNLILEEASIFSSSTAGPEADSSWVTLLHAHATLIYLQTVIAHDHLRSQPDIQHTVIKCIELLEALPPHLLIRVCWSFTVAGSRPNPDFLLTSPHFRPLGEAIEITKMRLVNARTLQLEEFFGEGIPKYAILSHTWVDGQEVTFQEFSTEKARDKSGWAKIEKTALLALEDGLEHVWIDTCCIDKTSSAELTEAINSMMSWYEQSQVCYTYLVDVPSDLGQNEQEYAFRNSRWFTRGWTLQELLAPSKLIFVFANWSRFDTRDEMASLVSSITGIDIPFLHTPDWENKDDLSVSGISTVSGGSRRAKLDSASIAQRMSWASKRQTTRVEDVAYCLLGIFGINMPLLYGEGPKAFLRLQEQILMGSDDQSILAWNFEGFETERIVKNGDTWTWDYHRKPTFAGFLAASPSAFSTCQNIRRVNIGKPTLHSLITNKGLRLELPLGHSPDCPCAFLQCQDKYAPASIVALPLRATREGFYVRAKLPLRLVDYQLLLNHRPTELYALKYGDYSLRKEKSQEYTVMIRNLPKDVEVLRAWSESGNLGPYSQIILAGNDRDDESSGAALLLGNRSSSKAQCILLVASRRKTTTSSNWPSVVCRLIELDGSSYGYLDDWGPKLPELQKRRDSGKNHEDVLRTLGSSFGESAKPPAQTFNAADGVCSTSTEIQDCFGKTVIFVDVSIRPRPFNGTRTLTRQIPLWFRNHMQGHKGISRAVLLFVLAPRVFTTVVEFLVKKVLEIASKPWYMFPLMTSFACLSAGDPPRFLVSALERAHKMSSATLKHWAVTSLLTYLSCTLMGSDMALNGFKRLLTGKELWQEHREVSIFDSRAKSSSLNPHLLYVANKSSRRRPKGINRPPPRVVVVERRHDRVDAEWSTASESGNSSSSED
ncbi:het domain-containing [Fusarium albosuccineum]|uniref:Het domain-containing n=1 Tax=Fusarium albosuccineum TaxID=1237068 RepID=A0A8H4PEG4_9HYPO|nr:het domain-containing [Fusarium albosuccineum]